MSTSSEATSRTSTPYPAEEECAAPPAEAVFVKLFVGPENRLFEIREDVICDRCPFFFNAFKKSFVEAKTKTLNFPDDDVVHFEDLQEWLRNEHHFNSTYTWLALSKTWLFADKYHIDELQKSVINVLYAKYAQQEDGININFATLDYIAEYTGPRSPLRGLFADMLANGLSLQQLPSRLENIPHEFLQDMCLALKAQVHRNGPANVSLLTNPITTYYPSDSGTANPKPKPAEQSNVQDAPAEQSNLPEASVGRSNVRNFPKAIFCEGLGCRDKEPRVPLRDTLHICTNHNIKLCHDCRHSHHGHRKKLMTLTSAPYQDAVTGDMTIVDAQVNDSGFFCDSPRCDTRLYDMGLPPWALQSGDRYHCLVCINVDYCSVCVRGELACKTNGHLMLRIRPTFARTMFMTEKVTIKERQRRLKEKLCLRCSSAEHGTHQCDGEQLVTDTVADPEE